MTTIEEKRVEFLKYKHNDYSADKVEFLVKTGLTFDTTKTKKVKGEEKQYKDIDWLKPKGVAFVESEDDGSSDGSTTEPVVPPVNQDPDEQTTNQVNDLINSDSEPEVTTTDPVTGEQTTEPLDPASTVNVVTGQDDDDDPDNNPDPIADDNGDLITTND